jgi:hypothetical protein
MAAHPLLLGGTAPVFNQSKKDRYKPMVPKFASIKVRQSCHQGRREEGGKGRMNADEEYL